MKSLSVRHLLILFMHLTIIAIPFTPIRAEDHGQTQSGSSDGDLGDLIRRVLNFFDRSSDDPNLTHDSAPPCIDCRIWQAGESPDARPTQIVGEPLPPLVREPQVWDSPDLSGQPSACQSFYQEMYAKDVIDMRTTYGYMDSVLDAGTSDYYYSENLIEQAKQPCGFGQGLCGFVESGDDPHLFLKMIKMPDGQVKTIQLRVHYSSFTEKDDENRLNADEQRKQSRKACGSFEEGLRSGTAVNLYVGHARGGYGPDCEVPEVHKDGWANLGHPKYTAKTSIKQINTILAKTPATDRPKLLGIMACDAQKHFGPGLQKSSPPTALALAAKVEEFSRLHDQATAALDSALAMRCDADFIPRAAKPPATSKPASEKPKRQAPPPAPPKPRRSGS